MTKSEERVGIVPIWNQGSSALVRYPLDLNVIRRMQNPLGMLFGKVRNGGTKWHHGWDLFAAPGTPVLCIDDGTIVETMDTGNGPGKYGKQIFVELRNLRSNGEKLFLHLAHLNGIAVQKGQVVKMGQCLGVTGITGNADISAPHLHFELRVGKHEGPIRVDPAEVYPDLYAAYVSAVGLSPVVMRNWPRSG